jgi:3-deoxy-7-phosphoheptulonate synthase
MIIVMKPGTSDRSIERVIQQVALYNVRTETKICQQQVTIVLFGNTDRLNPEQIQAISPDIETVLPIPHPFKRASLEFRHGEYSEIVVPTPHGDVAFGKNAPLVNVAGPCSVESEPMIIDTAFQLKAAGAQFLRGGAYKPRTSPYDFQGHGELALEWLATARQETGLGIITEVMDTAELDLIAEVADIIQIGARNMQNFSLLKKVGATGKPVLLKRGMSATIQEWLMAAEYILAAGNPNVILCERGIRTFDKQYTRNTFDISVIPVLRELTHLPIMLDPSHATGKSQYVASMALAAIAAGTDSLMIEVHPNPAKALSDGPQSLTPEQYYLLMEEMKVMAMTVGRSWKSTSEEIFSKIVWSSQFAATA